MMLPTIEHIIELARKADAGTVTAAELGELVAWTASVQAPEDIAKLEALSLEWLRDRYPERLDDPRNWDGVIAKILAADKPERLPDTKVKNTKVFRFKKYWVAASIVLLLGLGFFFYQQTQRQAASPEIANQTPKDISAPATNRAMITLADGRTVYLDSVDNGQLAQLGNIKLVKLANGQIAYQTAGGEIIKELQYNTLTNPRGSKVIDMRLSDGSHVWLNAGSSITYPVAFIGGERKVELKGEGYFEVAKDPSKKFIVTSNGVNTEVLGTHFNINAYNDDAVIKVTLLEGSVRTGNSAGSIIIKPGQQAKLRIGERNIPVLNADLDQVMAWKNGAFNFKGLSIDDVMSQIENWYNIKVEYKSGKPNIRLVGKLGRDLSLLEVMESLKDVGIRCHLQGNVLTID